GWTCLQVRRMRVLAGWTTQDAPTREPVQLGPGEKARAADGAYNYDYPDTKEDERGDADPVPKNKTKDDRDSK
ncbi:hypothetical protein V5799_004552, partial [Amblyomma americanum]